MSELDAIEAEVDHHQLGLKKARRRPRVEFGK